MSDLEKDREERRLQRRERRRARREARAGTLGMPPAVSSAGRGLAMASSVLALLALFTGHWIMFAIAVLGALVSGAVAALPFIEDHLGPSPLGLDPERAQVGMGATVASGAVIESGARVDMGATVSSGAVVKRGAVVGMGATVEQDVTLEEDVMIGWGATVRRGAVVKRGSTIGAGAVVEREAVVPPFTRISPGGVAPTTRVSTGQSPNRANADSRDSRIDELCDRVEGELRQVSPALDSFLSQPRETLQKLRTTAHDLLRRERELRLAANPADQERLNRESAALEERIAAETDDVTRERLTGAVAAIAEQRRQRGLLLRDANRLEAEQTRLVWTVEGLLSHVLRLRSTEAGPDKSVSAELDQSLSRLRDEVSAVAGAMDHAKALELAGGPDVSAGDTTGSPTRTPTHAD